MTGPSSNNQNVSGVVIGLNDLYTALQELNRNYTRLDTKVDVALGNYQNRFESFVAALLERRQVSDDHERRIRALEVRPVVTPRAVWGAMGVLTAVAALMTTIIMLIIQHG